jgi:hypothetical protein
MYSLMLQYLLFENTYMHVILRCYCVSFNTESATRTACVDFSCQFGACFNNILLNIYGFAL